jgi:hypothetical protein
MDSNELSLSLMSGENPEIFCLIWLDLPTNNNQENLEIQQQFRSIINHLKIFQDIDECEQYIRSLTKDDRIVFVSHEKFASEIINHIHELRQITSIYIYSTEIEKDYEWINQYKKVRLISNLLNHFKIFIVFRSNPLRMILMN